MKNPPRPFRGLCLLACLLAAAGPQDPKPPPLFAFCMDTHDGRKRTLPQQAEMLKELGYAGAGHLWLDKVEERLKTLDEAGLRLFQVYVRADVSAKAKQGYDPRLKDVLPLLKGRDVQLALLLQGRKPADPEGEPRAVELVREIADLAKESSSSPSTRAASARSPTSRRNRAPAWRSTPTRATGWSACRTPSAWPRRRTARTRGSCSTSAIG